MTVFVSDAMLKQMTFQPVDKGKDDFMVVKDAHFPSC